MTYADKYALMKAYKISTGDDPDQNASVDTHYSNVRAGQSNTKVQATPRQELIAELHRRGIDVNIYAQRHGLNGQTAPEVFQELLEELRNG